jgi:hypothetical protein
VEEGDGDYLNALLQKNITTFYEALRSAEQ